MSRPSVAPGELIPVADRIRWMMASRAAIVAALLILWSTADSPPGEPALGWAIPPAWLALTALSVLAARRERDTAVAALTMGLLGDGILLAWAWWSLGDLDGPTGYLILLHAVSVALLASFRTGVKVALWHSLLALLILEAVAAGVLGGPEPVPLGRLTGYLCALWASVLGAASCAAMNERELRRRRYDSEVLRTLGTALAAEQETPGVARLLARFARAELLAGRSAVVVFPTIGGTPEAGLAVVVDGDATPVTRAVPSSAVGESTLAGALARRAPVLTARFDPAGDPTLAALLPDADNVIVVPFSVEQATGALVMRHARRSWLRSPRRVERRLVNTAEQATVQTALAIGRAVVTDRVRAAAETDGLTGVANRRRFDTLLDRGMSRVRTDGGALAIVMIDLDHFKQLNDRHGHLVGDEVLRGAARAIAAACADDHVVARYGGEEFAVILSGVELQGAVGIAEEIRARIAVAAGRVPVTASIGVALAPEHGDQGTAVLAAADAALYRAKASGRNRVEVASAAPVAC